MLIKNYQQLATNNLRQNVLDIMNAGILAVEPRAMLSSLLAYNEDFNSVKVFNTAYDMMRGRIFVLGAGKASGAMAEALEKIIGDQHITAGLVAVKEKQYKCKKIKFKKAGHPFPDKKSLQVTRNILAFKNKYNINTGDLVICLISGGASAMLAAPVAGISLGDQQKTAKLLLESGANIREINTVRKHLSRIKGGRLAQFLAPAQVVSLIISDVQGDKPEIIGSGPTVADDTTFSEAFSVLQKYNLLDRIPSRIKQYIMQGAKGDIKETPPRLINADNYIIGNNSSALEAMAHQARSMGLRPIIVANDIKGDPNVVAYQVVRHILQKRFRGYDVLLYAGETNPKLPAKYGRGGRNQQFAAASMLALQHLDFPWAMGSISTDGIDYDLSVAGALVDKESLAEAERRHIAIAPYVRTYDTYSLFKKMGQSLIRTGPTGTNVADLIVYRLKY